jgi:general nucleoside transport system ATP-binding protein
MGNVNQNIILEALNITKEFPKVKANDDISIALQSGEILALLGENGAGKSTLMNILYGLYRQTSGTILLKGKEVSFSSPKDAIDLGLGMVHQHFMLVETMTVTENIILGNEPGRFGVVNKKNARKEVKELSERYHLKVNPDAKIADISVGLQQRVEILKALYRKAEILILDEPTAVLTPQEVDELFTVIRNLRDQGVSIIIITHKLEEVKAISERVYILRKGKVAGERRTSEATTAELANLMVGREVVLTVRKEELEVSEKPVFHMKDVSCIGERGNRGLKNISLSVCPGEIVGIAGVDGNGQSELAESIMGLRKLSKGSITLRGKDLKGLSTRKRYESGVSYVPADRQKAGLILPMKISENLILGYHYREPYAGSIMLRQNKIKEDTSILVDQYDIRTPSAENIASSLSGGNQQKVILARELSKGPDFLLVSQPTRGLDVGAIEYIHSQILDIRKEKSAILLISLELEEIFSLSDRILVLYEGSFVKELITKDTNKEEVGYYMMTGKSRMESDAS